jgi:hypothetical protein
MTAGYPSPQRRVTAPIRLACTGEPFPEPACLVELTETKHPQFHVSANFTLLTILQSTTNCPVKQIFIAKLGKVYST